MAALRHSGTEYEGNGIAAIREAMAYGVRLPLATFAVIEHIAEVVPAKLVGIYILFDDHGGIISVYPHAHCPVRLRSAIGVDLQAVGFKCKNYGAFGGWELKVERVLSNPRKRSVTRRRNPTPEWSRNLQIKGDRATWFRKFSARMLARIRRHMRDAEEATSKSQIRQAAADLVLDSYAIIVVVDSHAWDDTYRDELDAQLALDDRIAMMTNLIDAKIDVILGRWGGARRVTANVAQPGNVSFAEDLSSNVISKTDPAIEDLGLLVSKIRGAAAISLMASEELVKFDDETKESFGRITNDSLMRPTDASLGIMQPRVPGRSVKNKRKHIAEFRRKQYRDYHQFIGKDVLKLGR